MLTKIRYGNKSIDKRWKKGYLEQIIPKRIRITKTVILNEKATPPPQCESRTLSGVNAAPKKAINKNNHFKPYVDCGLK
jgi:hypothetical protein